MMKLRSLFSFLFLIASSLVFADSPAPMLPTLAPVLKNAMPAIVNVAVQGYIPNGVNTEEEENDEEQPQEKQAPQRSPLPDKPKKFQSIGSGVIMDPAQGIVLTNDHVIRNASVITVTVNDGRRLKAKLVGSDAETDIAVLKIDAKNLKSLPIGDSDKIEVGDFVVAIGNPFGLNSFGNSQSATFGIVSAMKRSDLNIEGIENFIQTDAAINPGNSGGALVNVKGELVGINTAIISLYGGSVGIGFAIPINMAKDVAQQIIKYGSVHRGLMGVFVQHLTPELAQALGYPEDFQGALVSQVNQNSPAEAAGLKPGDIIVQINDTKITQATQVKTTVSLLRVGSKVTIKLKRDGKDLTLNSYVTDIKQHEQKMQAQNPFLYGLALKDFEQDSPLHGHIVGVQVVGASENSAGWRAGIRPGDVIISANNQPVHSTKDLQNIAHQKKNQLLVQVLRGAGALYILVI
ncbi:periplasmic serine protease Do; heat shock protein HtrA (plasmid) [Legionella adelaidensis]|uniref:Periplasmic serine protease Do heat shock protein HtrA n=1 Tax=Legionella adelaidensis TaxID=45056 RepID=A0A0W0R4D2_9GAMM|nr:Do family serine endopeptidase [Legionella adelaidensis]KTC65940.1 periplasmic serine protease, Do/DeqQ family [Legionella adelaidensis]VEH85560.1 periplasmic serine protease Do; heat shock protein HtrA [Legionella adelaidensis]